MNIFLNHGRVVRISMVLFFLFFTSFSWAAEQAKKDEVVARVNDEPVMRKDFDAAVNSAKQQFAGIGWQEGDAAQLEKLHNMALDRLIDLELLYQASKKEGITVDTAEVDEQLAGFKKQFPSDEEFAKFMQTNELTEKIMKEQLSRRMALEGLQKKLREDFTAKAQVGDEEIRKFYDDNMEKMKEPEKVRASHILVTVAENADEKTKAAAMAKIKDIQKKIKDGGDFAQLAKENSDCPSKEQGGDLNYFVREQMVKPFADAAFATPVGQVSDIVTTNFGHHLIKVVDKKAETTLTFDQVKEKIKTFLAQQELDAMFQDYIKGLRDKAKIERLLAATKEK
ncbi:MAG: peptidylprolyl isomerase [Thermodesulfobacteriota bacterium]